MIRKYNTSLRKWASSRGVHVVELYNYIEKHIDYDKNGGIHYSPKPTKKLWNYIVKVTKKYVV